MKSNKISLILLFVNSLFFNVLDIPAQENIDEQVINALESKDSVFLYSYWNHQALTNPSKQIPDVFFKLYSISDFFSLLYLYQIDLIHLNTEVFFDTTLLDLMIKYLSPKQLEIELISDKNKMLKYKGNLTPLMIMARQNRPDLVIKYQDFFDIHALDHLDGNIFLYCGQWNNTSYIKKLIEIKIEICQGNFVNENILSKAVQNGNKILSSFLMDNYNCLYDPKVNKLIDESIQSGNLDLINYFATLEQDLLNEKSSSGEPLLHQIVSYYPPERNQTLFSIISILKEKGYDLDLVDKNGNPVLTYCGYNLELFTFLKKSGADTMWVNNERKSLRDLLLEQVSLNVNLEGSNEEVYNVISDELILDCMFKLIIIKDWEAAQKLYQKYSDKLSKTLIMSFLFNNLFSD